MYIIAVDASKPENGIVSVKKWLRYLKSILKNDQGYGLSRWSDIGRHCPIAIVVCKSDLIRIEDAISLRKAKEFQGLLREICMGITASLLYTSSAADINCTRLRSFIVYSLNHHYQTNKIQQLSSESQPAFITQDEKFDVIEVKILIHLCRETVNLLIYMSNSLLMSRMVSITLFSLMDVIELS